MSGPSDRELQKIQSELKFQSYVMMNRHKAGKKMSFGKVVFWLMVVFALYVYADSDGPLSDIGNWMRKMDRAVWDFLMRLIGK